MLSHKNKNTELKKGIDQKCSNSMNVVGLENERQGAIPMPVNAILVTEKNPTRRGCL